MQRFYWIGTNRSRFQITLYRSGDIAISFNGIQVRDGIAGVFSGSGAVRQPTQFSALPAGTTQGTTVYEAFYYRPFSRGTPRNVAADMMKVFYSAYQDVNDFTVLFTDFRFDMSEAAAPSLGPSQDQTQGIGTTNRGESPGTFGSRGRFQSGMLPSWIGGPAYGIIGTNKDGTFNNGRVTDYDPARYLISHELGHRWLAYLEYMDGGKRKPRSDPIHWLDELHVPAASPVQQQFESSPMNGSYWLDNRDGSFTTLASGDFVSTGYSYLDLYGMGLLRAEAVPDFFILENLVRIPFNGPYTVRASKKPISMNQVIAAMGPRVPSADTSQKQFSTSFVLLVPKDAKASSAGLQRIDGIRRAWEDHFGKATGNRGSMTTALKRRVPSRLIVVSGNGQSGVAGSALSQPIIVEVQDDSGAPVSGVPVNYVAQNATITSSAPKTNLAGRAQAIITLGSELGSAVITVATAGATVRFEATVGSVPSESGFTIRNGASGEIITTLVPNTWTTVHGNGLAVSTATASSGPFPDALGGTSVLIRVARGVVAAPLYYASLTQINFLVPDLGTVASTSVTVKLIAQPQPIAEIPMGVGTSLPGAFQSVGTALMTDPAGRVLQPSEALQDGQIYVGYFNGLGTTIPRLPPNQIVPPLLYPLEQSVRLELGGGQADVLFAGLTPGLIGVYQINFRHQLRSTQTPRSAGGKLTMADGNTTAFTITVQ